MAGYRWTHLFDSNRDVFSKNADGYRVFVINYWYLHEYVTQGDRIPGLWYVYSIGRQTSTPGPAKRNIGCFIQLEVAKRAAERYISNGL